MFSDAKNKIVNLISHLLKQHEEHAFQLKIICRITIFAQKLIGNNDGCILQKNNMAYDSQFSVYCLHLSSKLLPVFLVDWRIPLWKLI